MAILLHGSWPFVLMHHANFSIFTMEILVYRPWQILLLDHRKVILEQGNFTFSIMVNLVFEPCQILGLDHDKKNCSLTIFLKTMAISYTKKLFTSN